MDTTEKVEKGLAKGEKKEKKCEKRSKGMGRRNFDGKF